MKNRFGIIPSLNEIQKFNSISQSEDLFFEYNDFYIPAILDDPALLESTIESYLKVNRDHSRDTLHGAFFDVNPASDDPAMRKVSDNRIRQSLAVARRIGVRGVVFHTNYITNFLLDSYRKNWVKASCEYYSSLLEEYNDIDIYIENMFDNNADLLNRLAEALKGYKNFGVCLDYAHFRVFGDNPTDSLKLLAPYVKHMHINDNFGISDDHLPLGEGDTDWALFLSSMEKYGLNRSDITILIEHKGLDKLEKSLQFIKSNF